jgi:hypothetical protein
MREGRGDGVIVGRGATALNDEPGESKPRPNGRARYAFGVQARENRNCQMVTVACFACERQDRGLGS